MTRGYWFWIWEQQPSLIDPAANDRVGPMHVVVNHLHLRDPMPPEMIEKAHEAVRSVVDAGGRAAQVAKVDDRHLVLILVFNGPEDAARVARDVGGPWMRENIVPLLARDTERSVGEIIASAQG